MASIQKTYNSMGLPMNINRSNPIPVDNTELWYSLADAQDYAANGATAYVGQSIKVIDESTGDITWYMIGADGSLIDKIEELSGVASDALETAKSYTDAEIAEWVGDSTVALQISTAINNIEAIPDSEIIALFSS